jgi:hypothetical protein
VFKYNTVYVYRGPGYKAPGMIFLILGGSKKQHRASSVYFIPKKESTISIAWELWVGCMPFLYMKQMSKVPPEPGIAA